MKRTALLLLTTTLLVPCFLNAQAHIPYPTKAYLFFLKLEYITQVSASLINKRMEFLKFTK